MGHIIGNPLPRMQAQCWGATAGRVRWQIPEISGKEKKEEGAFVFFFVHRIEDVLPRTTVAATMSLIQILARPKTE